MSFKFSTYLFVITASFLFTAGFYILSAHTALAATIYVHSSTGNDTTGNGTAGSPYKTFHKAYTMASSSDTINLTGTFNWANSDETGDVQYHGYEISKNLTITGQNASDTIVQAANDATSGTRRIFTIKNGYTATIQNVKIRYGRNATDYNGRDGGGILVENGASLTVQDAHITQNYVNSTSWGGFGGGINNLGTLTVNRSTIDNNFAQSQGGGVLNAYLAGNTNTSYITNSTIAFNSTADTTATVGGAGLYIRSGTTYVTNTTIAYNDAPSGTGDTTGIDIVSGATLSIKNSIVALNRVGGSPVNASSGNWFDLTNSGTLTDLGGNIFGKVNTAYSGVSFHNSTWYDLYGNGAGDNTYKIHGSTTTGSLYLDTALANNSTLNNTQTLAITNASSIAISAGQSGSNGSISVPIIDQRQYSRVSTVDAGAYEYGAASNSNPSTPTSLGGSGYVDGSSSNDTTPTLSFILADTDSSDTVRFQIQIDNNADFSSPIVEYLSALSSQGTTSFTVGQSAGSGSYSIGNSGQTLVDSSYYWRVKAIDNSAAESSYATANSGSIAFIIDATAPVISSVTATPSSTSAVIAWSTDTLASSQLQYGLTSNYGTSTALLDIAPRVLAHTITLSGLTPCTSYYYLILSVDAATNNTTYTAVTPFTTVGCTGSATPSIAQSTSFNSAGAGGSLSNNGSTVLQVPTGFTTGNTDAVFQIHTLEDTTFFATAGTPNGRTRVGTTVINLKAFTGINTQLSVFVAPITVQLAYAPTHIAGLNEDTLTIYRYDGNSWYALSNCSTNKTSRIVSCTTQNFSDFAIFGQPITGGGLPPEAFAKPIVPDGGFKIQINNGALTTNLPQVTLRFNAGPDIARMSVSHNSELSNTSQEPYINQKTWNICTTTPCENKPYTVYVRFYTAYGQPSETISTTINYSPHPNNTLLLDNGTIYVLLQGHKYGFTSMTAFTGLGYSLKNVRAGDTSTYVINGLLQSRNDAHPVGSWVQNKKTIYYVSNDGLIPIARWEDFINNGGESMFIVPANKSDLTKKILSIMAPTDPRVIK